MPSSLQPIKKLDVISGDDHPTKAVILVGGIHDTYNYFDGWKKGLEHEGTVVVGFDHDHTKSKMSEAGAQLAEAIRQLGEQGITDVQVVAHSMGGLVSKAALNELARSGEAADFNSIQLDALGTPWGGFAIGDLAAVTPFADTVSEKVGFPMGPEIGPSSKFMKSLDEAWPENMTFNVYQGTADGISLPAMPSTKDRYNEIIGQADALVFVKDYHHSDYRNATPALLAAAENEPVAGFETTDIKRGYLAEFKEADAARETATPEEPAVTAPTPVALAEASSESADLKMSFELTSAKDRLRDEPESESTTTAQADMVME